MTENQTTPEPDAPTGYAGSTGAGTETPPGAEPPPPGAAGAATPPFPPRRPPLRRSRNDRVLTGVCGGFAENLGVDATLIRILVVVATVFSGGALILAYLVAWALMPDTPLQPVAVYVTPAPTQPEPAMAGAEASTATATAAYPTAAYPASYAAGGTGTYVDPATGAVYGTPAYPPPPRRTEPRSYLGLITLSAAVAVGGLFALAGALGASIPGLVPAAAILVVLGVGLLVGAWRGRARWLIVPALVMVLVVQGIAAVNNVVSGAGSGVGERTWTPTTSSSTFQLGAGSARLDLRELPAGDANVKVSLGLGELIVLVPPGTAVELTGSVGAGEVDLPGQRPVSGTDMKIEKTVDAVGGTGTTTTVELDAQVGLGQLEVRRAAS